jgi:hypothetical protein
MSRAVTVAEEDVCSGGHRRVTCSGRAGSSLFSHCGAYGGGVLSNERGPARAGPAQQPTQRQQHARLKILRLPHLVCHAV